MNTILVIILVVLIVFFVNRVLNGCPFRRNHDWEYVGTEIHETYNGPKKYKKYVCKNCSKIEYEQNMTREEIERNRQYQLTGAAIDYCRENHPYYEGDTLGEITDAFEAGADWEYKRLVDKVRSLIEENIDYACLHLGNYMEKEVDAKELSEWICKTLEE